MPVAFKEANGCMVKPSTCLEERSTLQQILDADDGALHKDEIDDFHEHLNRQDAHIQFTKDCTALLSDAIEEAQQLLSRVENECKKIGLGLNGLKTKSIVYNIEDPEPLCTQDGTELEWKDDVTYLGSWVDSPDKDITIRKAQAWKALNGMSRIWSSKMKSDLKKRFFIATVESIRYMAVKAELCLLPRKKFLNGTYTRMLRKALNIHWSSHTPNEQRYGELPAVSDRIASSRLQLAGHCYRHPELSTQKLVPWQPTHGHLGRGRRKTEEGHWCC
ncbi:uncharacterized protein [Montipora capricornis]|uniref:uncharacterized protein n=1 Tax=Montipora capricornis TaxID=246305 RepID=UPI0035F1309E